MYGCVGVLWSGGMFMGMLVCCSVVEETVEGVEVVCSTMYGSAVIC